MHRLGKNTHAESTPCRHKEAMVSVTGNFSFTEKLIHLFSSNNNNNNNNNNNIGNNNNMTAAF